MDIVGEIEVQIIDRDIGRRGLMGCDSLHEVGRNGNHPDHVQLLEQRLRLLRTRFC